MTYSLNTLNNDRRPTRGDDDAKPTGFRRFAQEIALTAGFVFMLFWLLALLTHNPLDPAWTTSGTGNSVRNFGGRLGAWLGDMSFFLLGYSVWWCYVAALVAWLAALAERLREDDAPPADGLGWRHTRFAFWAGLALLLVSSVGLEWTRLYRFEGRLPGHVSGGVLGYLVGPFSLKWLGFNGSGLIFIVFGVVGASWVFRFSWAQTAENIGAWVDGWIEAWRERREREQDEAYGQAAAREREEVVFEERVEIEEHHPVPVVIEPEMVEVPKSARVAKERQKPLFTEMVDSRLPQVDLLDGPLVRQDTVAPETLEMTSRMIEKKLKDFGVEVRVVAASPGPVITRYEIEPATGVKGSQVMNLAKDLARSLSLVSIRVVETIPGKNYMALELPNAKRQSIRLSEILGSDIYNEAKSMLTMGLGKDIVGNPVVADLAKMPHVLVAGTTGSGKSVGINAMILSLLYKAEARDVRLLMIDPKMLEMSVYEGIPHLLAPVVTDMRQAAQGLNWCVGEMEKRYKLMSKLGVRNLAGYNAKIDEAAAREEFIYNPFSLTPEQPEPLQRLPHIVVVIDELADLMMVVGKKIEELIARLAQKARAAGIHLILATQRPSVDVITGLIKANIPTRIAFQVSSKIDSRTILDQMGAEALLGMGDMLYMASGTGLPIRVHGAFVSDEEVHRVVSYLKTQGEPDYIEGVLEGGTVDGEGNASGPDLFGDAPAEKDPMYDQAVEVVLKNRKASISLVQRHLKIGYNRAARLVEDMEKAGMVSAMSNNGQREILVPKRDE
ncbi:cell division protein FtsK [Limnohabitans sp. JirII-29]|uniref:DNA translocase FtsK n=1 Tax=Limnohabitans sp. JirII-29 TaxID=1835756 RepID=UPI000D3B2377|nr:DNA translocase FtsK [Limnohabitans sp. JirII-29]PUE25374.1 cell division protein FtsK [Limnohabitans sp. JirII-29]